MSEMRVSGKVLEVELVLEMVGKLLVVSLCRYDHAFIPERDYESRIPPPRSMRAHSKCFGTS